MNAAQKRDAVLDKSPFAELWLTVFCGRKTAVNYRRRKDRRDKRKKAHGCSPTCRVCNPKLALPEHREAKRKAAEKAARSEHG